MRALTVIPLKADSAAIIDIKEPDESQGDLLVETLLVGVCGTDAEIVAGDYGAPPPGHERLVLGHESLGRVLEAPGSSGFTKGDLVVGIVRRPDPVPCFACAAGQWDACQNGQYTEHGIKELDGFMRERYRVKSDAAVRLDPALGDLGVLLEPTTVVTKAWAQVDAVGARAAWKPKTALIVGAGPIGLLAALLATQRGLEVHVVDRVATGSKPDLVTSLGATYHSDGIANAVSAPDVIIECTGVPALCFQAAEAVGTDGVVCLTGISPASSEISLDAGPFLRSMVLGNKVIVGSVNANRGHYEHGAAALAAAPKDWLSRLVTRRVPLEHFQDALRHADDDVKVVIEIGK